MVAASRVVQSSHQMSWEYHRDLVEHTNGILDSACPVGCSVVFGWQVDLRSTVLDVSACHSNTAFRHCFQHQLTWRRGLVKHIV